MDTEKEGSALGYCHYYPGRCHCHHCFTSKCITTKKAYQYKHTVDPIEENQHVTSHKAGEENTYHNEQR